MIKSVLKYLKLQVYDKTMTKLIISHYFLSKIPKELKGLSHGMGSVNGILYKQLSVIWSTDLDASHPQQLGLAYLSISTKLKAPLLLSQKISILNGSTILFNLGIGDFMEIITEMDSLYEFIIHIKEKIDSELYKNWNRIQYLN